MAFAEHKKITQAQREMYVAVNELRSKMTKEVAKHFDNSFVNEGFTYNSLMKWRERKKSYPHKILQKTGRLRRSIKTKVFTTKSYYEVRFSSDVPYADVHNEGLKAGRGRGFTMPKRQFMGYSRSLDLRIKRMYERKITQIFPQ